MATRALSPNGMIPYYTINPNKNGKAYVGEHKIYKLPPFWYVSVSEVKTPQNVTGYNYQGNIEEKRLNPFRDLQKGGTLFGFKQKHYWFSDKTILGKLLRFIFKTT